MPFKIETCKTHFSPSQNGNGDQNGQMANPNGPLTPLYYLSSFNLKKKKKKIFSPVKVIMLPFVLNSCHTSF